MSKGLHRDPLRRCMPVAEWPDTDRQLWQSAIVTGDLLDEGGVRAGHSPISNRNIARGYGRWLTWLHTTDQLSADMPPADRITPERVPVYIAHLHTSNRISTVTARLDELQYAAVVMDGERNWRWIRRIAVTLRARRSPVRVKRSRLVHARDLLLLGERLMARAVEQSAARLRARTFRNGLIIAFLAARPLRVRNLAGLEVDRTLVQRGDAWWIAIPAEETKTCAPIDVPWPDELRTPLMIYLREHRPLLCSLRGCCTRPAGNALWVSMYGSPMRPRTLYEMIVTRTAEAFGQPINPHLFRDCAATSIAIDDPEHVRIASQILGHRSTATRERYYNQAHTIEAARLYQAFLVAFRSGNMADDRFESPEKP